MIKNFYVFAAIILALGLVIVPAYSQEAESENYGFGEVVKVSPESITILEYDFDKYEEVEVTYTVNKDVALENLAAINDIKEGDYIEITYKQEGDVKIAKVISKVALEETGDEGADLGEAETVEADENVEVPINAEVEVE